MGKTQSQTNHKDSRLKPNKQRHMGNTAKHKQTQTQHTSKTNKQTTTTHGKQRQAQTSNKNNVPLNQRNTTPIHGEQKNKHNLRETQDTQKQSHLKHTISINTRGKTITNTLQRQHTFKPHKQKHIGNTTNTNKHKIQHTLRKIHMGKQPNTNNTQTQHTNIKHKQTATTHGKQR